MATIVSEMWYAARLALCIEKDGRIDMSRGDVQNYYGKARFEFDVKSWATGPLGIHA